MLSGDPHFLSLVTELVGSWPFRSLKREIHMDEGCTDRDLFHAFVDTFTGDDAMNARNVLFFWAVERPFMHTEGNGLASTISYIEISRRTIAERWPCSFFRNLTKNRTVDGSLLANFTLEQLAAAHDNLAFYGRLIQRHGPMRVWYATHDELNECAVAALLPIHPTVREWERRFIRGYREVHGRRPLKNFQD